MALSEQKAFELLHAILLVRGISMTFQRERENTTEQIDSYTTIQAEKDTKQENTEKVIEKKREDKWSIHLIKKREMLSVRIL